MSSGKKWTFKNLITSKGGCGCWPKTTDVIEPKPSFSDQKPSSSPPENHDCCKMVSPACPKIHDSLAVVQDSDDPYRDFRQSMLQMIFEKEIYSGDDLQQLLHCFLDLNPPHHHHVIVQSFMEIWNGGEEETPPAR